MALKKKKKMKKKQKNLEDLEFSPSAISISGELHGLTTTLLDRELIAYRRSRCGRANSRFFQY